MKPVPLSTTTSSRPAQCLRRQEFNGRRDLSSSLLAGHVQLVTTGQPYAPAPTRTRLVGQKLRNQSVVRTQEAGILAGLWFGSRSPRV